MVSCQDILIHRWRLSLHCWWRPAVFPAVCEPLPHTTGDTAGLQWCSSLPLQSHCCRSWQHCSELSRSRLQDSLTARLETLETWLDNQRHLLPGLDYQTLPAPQQLSKFRKIFFNGIVHKIILFPNKIFYKYHFSIKYFSPAWHGRVCHICICRWWMRGSWWQQSQPRSTLYISSSCLLPAPAGASCFSWPPDH